MMLINDLPSEPEVPVIRYASFEPYVGSAMEEQYEKVVDRIATVVFE